MSIQGRCFDFSFAVNRNPPTPTFRVVESENELDIISSLFHISFDKKRFSRNELSVRIVGKVTLWGSYWRYGQEAGLERFNLGGTGRILDLVDGRYDVGDGVLAREGYSALDDSQSMLFEDDGFVSPHREVDRVNGYLFCYGPDYHGVMTCLYDTSGR
ncbi:hypothetical protein NW762_013806 [Fusarium torreyae]|uniref:Uncharacterized protein n=1 Tax=Fusarium torreyae TaxID=1237075 RepID=A0A9W8V8F4_9HYPO|nr:hypothetical protein NW762_013806 [Fusarium torreyae]